MSQQAVYDALNKQIANWGILFIKLHNYHWFVKGTGFFELHTKFEEYYTSAATYIDEIAERLLAIGGKPVATMNEFLTVSSLKEATGQESSKDMVQSILNDLEVVMEEITKALDVIEELGDEPTGDMLIHIKTNLEKEAWMLKAYLS